MSSAEDTTPLTASPSANSTDSSAPSLSQTHASAPTDQAPPSDQTPDEPEDGAVAEAKTKPLPKVNAVAHETRVNVTGARPIPGAIERELFAESTTTVLVFEKGGVIRLVAAVAPGQLLFLTHEDSKREVVAQVVRKRAYRPAECYVELEFTEPAPKFWGMEFSAATALLPKDAKEAEAAALVASAETSEDDPAQATPAPTADEVLALRKEIDALRGQLSSLQTQAAAPPQAPAPPQLVPASDLAPVSPPAPVEPPVVPGSGRLKEEIAPNWMPAPTVDSPQASAPFEPAAVVPVAPPVVHKSLPLEPEPRPAATPPALPSMPAFDFAASLPKKKKRSFRARGNFTPGFRTGVLRLALLSTALVVTIIGAAWYKQWLPWQSAEKKIAVSSWPGSVAAAPSPAANAVNPAAAGTTGTGVAGAAPQNSGAETGSNGSEPSVGHAAESSSPLDVVRSNGHGKTTAAASLGKRSPARSTAPAHVESTSASSAEPAVVPPKLIKSARAVATLDDLRDFETGSVVIDALVDVTGNVTSMNILSGPPSLREPAMRALNNYKYEPATRHGVPVPAHVTVRIQFHFE